MFSNSGTRGTGVIGRRLSSVEQRRYVILIVGLSLMVAFIGTTAGSAIGGVDADGNADVVFVNYVRDFEESCRGDGTGVFVCSDFNVEDTTQGMAAGDVNGDGYVDVVLANDRGQAKVCLNDGTGSFPTCTDFGVPSLGGFDAALGDTNGDGFPDAIMANNGINQVCFNDGTGAFTSCSDIDSGVGDRFFSFAVDVGDLNGDGHLDAVFSNGETSTGQPHRVCAGDGVGGFACADVALELGNDFSSIALGLIDADDNLDVVFGNGAENRVCIGDGVGNFTGCHDVETSPVSGRSQDVALDFVDADGFLDAVFAVNGGNSRYCLGDGATNFTCADLPVTGGLVNAVATGYIDGGTDLDLVFADSSGNNRVCLGDGAGVFSCVALASSNVETTDVAIIPSAPDSDRDNVSDVRDACPETNPLGSDTPDKWKKNRFAVDSAGDFVDKLATSSGYTIHDTAGCDEAQIIESADLGKGHTRFGLSRSVLISWVASLSSG
jgi:hypothetical protein